MKTDTEILDWLEKNMNRILVTRGRYGVLQFKWATRDDTGLYQYHPPAFTTLREAAAAAIAFDQKQQEGNKIPFRFVADLTKEPPAGRSYK